MISPRFWLTRLSASVLAWIYRPQQTRRRNNRRRAATVAMVEVLESRVLLTTNLSLSTIALMDSGFNPIPSVAHGEQAFIRADFTTNDLPVDASYRIEFRVDGVPLGPAPLNFGAGLAVGNWVYGWGGWYASAGTHTAEVILDADNNVAEANESDNTLSFMFTTIAPSLPAKFIWPFVPGQAMSTVNYVDADLQSGQAHDIFGGPFTYDGHDAFDTNPGVSFARMDAGVPILAAADGTVVEAQDGNFDRWTSATNPPANYVVIDHGNNWRTVYYHFMRNTVTVKVGDTVSAGQIIGYMGSSGNSTGLHVHFGVQHDGRRVETMADAASYFVDPPTYEGNVAPEVMDSGLTNYVVWPDLTERPSDITTFPTSTNWDAWAWFQMSHWSAGDTFHARWYRPDGTLNTTFTYVAPTEVRGGTVAWILPQSQWSAFPGTWSVTIDVNGIDKSTQTFDVTTGTGQPEIRVTESGNIVLDERTTPLDFGTVATGSAAPQKTFTIRNHGAVALTTSDLVLPPGFSLAGAFPSSIAPDATATFTVQLDTTAVANRFGAIRFTTNDGDEGQFNFNVSGTVTGTVPAGTPVVSLPNPALVYEFGEAPQVLDSQATLSDSDSANFNGGNVLAEFASGLRTGDTLDVVHQGTGSGQIGVSGSAVSFGGTVIGTKSGGTNGNPLLIALNDAATPVVVQALIRAVAYSNVQSPNIAPRYVRVTATDDTGKISNQAVKTVITDERNETPTAVVLTNTTTTLAEDISTATRIKLADVGVTDDAHGTNVLSLSGTDSASFELDSGVLYLKAGTSLDFETQSSYAVTVNVDDPIVGSTPDASTNFTLTITDVNDAPVVGAFDTTVAYTANGAAVRLDTNATIADVDTARFGTGVLTISLTANAEANDRLEIRQVTRLIGVSGTNVTFRGTTIGTLAGGVGTADLVITFNANATVSAVQTVLRNVTYRSVSANPSTAPRTVRVTLTDGGGGTSNLPTKTINVAVPAPPLDSAQSAPLVAVSQPGSTTVGSFSATDSSAGRTFFDAPVAAKGSTDNDQYGEDVLSFLDDGDVLSGRRKRRRSL